MKSLPVSLANEPYPIDEHAKAFCEAFAAPSAKRYVFGRNAYAQSIAEVFDVTAFIDDFTQDREYLGKTIVKSDQVPSDALVVSIVIGKPFVAEKRLKQFSFRFLDYFAFARYTKDSRIAPVKFWNEFRADFEANRAQYTWLLEQLHDDESKETLIRIIHFRLSHDLNFMRGFTDAQHRQYFEDFLKLKSAGESFADVGSFDGYTSDYFIKQCPEYAAVYAFEPEPKNMVIVKQRLAGFPRVHYYEHGLSNASQILRFDASGSCSKISEAGDLEIKVERLDDVLQDRLTFVKMDIEGAERPALEGAKQAILQHHPRLALSVYHLFDDLWQIPRQVLSYRDDYDLYVRHYTEGVDETVMFFIPKR